MGHCLMGAYVNGVYVPALDEVGWDDEHNDFLTRSGKQFVDPTLAPYGADPTTVADSTAAIQAAIDDALGGPMSATVPTPTRAGRDAGGVGHVRVPAGQFRITAPLEFRGAQGLIFEGAGREATVFVVDGTFTQALMLLGVSHCTFRNFTIVGAGGFSGTGHVTYGVSYDWDPALTVQSSSRSHFENVGVRELDCKYAFAIGPNSTSYDVSECQWTNCHAYGDFTQGSGNTTQYQAGFLVGSGTFGNILNHYFDDCHVYYMRRGWNIDRVESVALQGCDGSFMEDFVYKAGPGAVTVRDARVETTWRLVDTQGGATFTSHFHAENVIWSPGAYGSSDGRFIKWQYGGSVKLDNCYIHPADNLQVQHVYVSCTTPTNPVYVIVDGLSVDSLLSTESFLEVANSTYAFLDIRGLIKTSGASYASIEPHTIISYNRSIPLTIGSTETAATTGTKQTNQLKLANAADDATGARALVYASGSSDKWWLYQPASDTKLYLRDITNARMLATFTPGSSVQASSMTLNGVMILPEAASDPAAVANNVVLFAKDNGSGKTVFYARFPTGAIVQIAIEP